SPQREPGAHTSPKRKRGNPTSSKRKQGRIPRRSPRGGGWRQGRGALRDALFRTEWPAMTDNHSPTASAETPPSSPPTSSAKETDPFYILAASPQADEQSRVLKQGDTFAVFDHYGDIKPSGMGEEGLYHEGTRYLSRLLLLLGTE